MELRLFSPFNLRVKSLVPSLHAIHQHGRFVSLLTEQLHIANIYWMVPVVTMETGVAPKKCRGHPLASPPQVDNKNPANAVGH